MDNAKTLIVGLGASAGGIQALKSFFSKMPANPDMAFVVVTHLSPTRESLLHEVIARFTTLPVSVIRHDDPVVAGTIHVLPENATLTIRKGRLQLIAIDPLHREHKPIDVFFSALAADQGDRAVGIVMSGGDGDGTLGVKAIKKNGGFSFAQVGDEPGNPSMPTSAVDSGWVDFAIPADEMPQKLVQLQTGDPDLTSFLQRAEIGALDADDKHLQEQIAQLLRRHSRHDFKGYKSKTFFRRVARRMQIAHVVTPDAYLDLLRQEPGEVMALFRDLLISVTDFFRDAEAFYALGTQVIPKLLSGRGAAETVRIWVPGCATGEEVFSIAILMREQMEGLVPCPRVQIFATDIDEPALAVARAARYPQELLNNLSEERRTRFFRKSGASYVLAREVRDMCIFSPHSIISDPPFSRMDLVSCRNLLIYLGPELQQQVIPTFHYALKPGGYLFLGRSESISQHEDLFTPLDKKQRIFQCRDLGNTRPRIPISLENMKAAHKRFDREEPPSSRTGSYQLRQRVLDQLMDRHIPAHVVIRAEGDIVYYSARTKRYFDTPEGAPNRQLLEVVQQELRPDLRSALRETLESSRSAMRHAVMPQDDKGRAVILTVEPLGGGTADVGANEALFLILFQPVAGAPEGVEGREPGVAGPDDGEAMACELSEMRDRLRSVIEEYETALEELKSTNEELVSVNQEAQSTNEELQSSREEMLSLNEELSTVNAELNDKVEELDRSSVDLKNLYEATGIATVFLDKDLMIRNFTPAASSFFRLRQSDLGRPLTDLASAIVYPGLKDDVRSVFESGKSVEHKLPPNDQMEHFLVRSTPYFDDSNITGVVMTFVEITSLAKAVEQQDTLIAELNHRVKNMLAVVLSVTRATQKSATSIAGFGEALTERLHSMAKAYGLVASRSWTEVPLHDLVAQEMAAFNANQIAMQGPQMLLPPERALSLAMVIHELATNAAKHGALSVPGGRISIDWSATDDGQLKFGWTEADGPPVEAPKRRGFGLDLLHGQIEGQLGGSLTMTFPPEGVVLELSCPLTS